MNLPLEAREYIQSIESGFEGENGYREARDRIQTMLDIKYHMLITNKYRHSGSPEIQALIDRELQDITEILEEYKRQRQKSRH